MTQLPENPPEQEASPYTLEDLVSQHIGILTNATNRLIDSVLLAGGRKEILRIANSLLTQLELVESCLLQDNKQDQEAAWQQHLDYSVARIATLKAFTDRLSKYNEAKAAAEKFYKALFSYLSQGKQDPTKKLLQKNELGILCKELERIIGRPKVKF
ncbi:hypothetical protein ACFL3T_02295 [Patescibacteria group bacterium]